MFSGHVRVLYTDYDHLLVHECLQETDDGHCEQGQEAIVVYGRTTDLLTADVVEKLRPLAQQACSDKADFEWVPHDGKYIFVVS